MTVEITSTTTYTSLNEGQKLFSGNSHQKTLDPINKIEAIDAISTTLQSTLEDAIKRGIEQYVNTVGADAALQALHDSPQEVAKTVMGGAAKITERATKADFSRVQ